MTPIKEVKEENQNERGNAISQFNIADQAQLNDFQTPQKGFRNDQPYASPNITPMGMNKSYMSHLTPVQKDGTYYINNITNNIIQMDKQKSKDHLERTETR